MMHHEGEYAVAAAAAAAGVPYTLSTMGTVTPEQLAAAGGDADRWFQLYLWKDRGATKDLVARAAASGYRALMLTVDTPVSGARLRDVRNGLTIPPNLTLRTLAGMGRHPSWWFNLLTTPPLTFASLDSTDGALADHGRPRLRPADHARRPRVAARRLDGPADRQGHPGRGRRPDGRRRRRRRRRRVQPRRPPARPRRDPARSSCPPSRRR